MIAIEISEPGGPDVLRVIERPIPEPADGEILVKVAAAGVNRPDLMQRQGHYPPPPGASDIPGLEVAGTVFGSAGRWHEGDHVCALVAGGGYAEYCAVPVPQVLPIPPGMPPEAAAALPETFFTVWTNLFERGGLEHGDRVLVQGGTSGIGTTAIQLAREFGATVFATAGSDEKCAACVELGATVAINYRTEDFVERVLAETGGHGVDIILDIIGGDYLSRHLACLATDGRLVQIGLMGGARAQIDLRRVLNKRLTITGSTLRPRTPAEKGAIAAALEARVWPLLAAGRVRPRIHRTFPLHEAAEAHRVLESGEVIGKVVLLVP
jgi:NADPH:quinone reductase